MEVKIKNENGEKKIELGDTAKVKEALKKADVNRETVIVEKDGEVVSSEEELEHGDRFRLINVVSGG